MSPQHRPHARAARAVSLPPCVRRLAPFAAAAALAPAAAAQITFSIDWKSQSIARQDSSPTPHPITEGDLLIPGPGAPGFGTLQAPFIQVFGSGLSLNNYASCVGHPAGTECGVEIDALSSGRDDMFTPGQSHGILGGGGGSNPTRSMSDDRWRVWFSVDEYARGVQPPVLVPQHPQVATEGTLGAPPPFEACADVFVDIGLPSGPLAPGASVPDSVGTLDGNGMVSASGFTYPGLGLLEPNPPFGPPPHGGDNLDALEVGTDLLDPGVTTYISLDSAFLDPLSGLFNSGSAAINGFHGGDVLATSAGPGGALSLYAPALVLGLDSVPGAGPGSDDIDALAVHENGDGVYQPSVVPYDWVGGSTDMLIFSVRRGSAVINQLDSIFGIPIQPGDLLTTPLPLANGGLSPYPGIFIAAENLGLFTARGAVGIDGDDLDALDVVKRPRFDCNENGVEDSVDIATGASADTNKNGIPDECEDKVVEYCFCAVSALAPCGNTDPAAGCKNSTTVGGLLLTNIGGGSSSTSVAADDLVFDATQLPANESALLFMGASSRNPVPFQDGLRCITTPMYRYAVQTSSTTGTLQYGPGIAALSALRFGPAGTINAGENWFFQVWYRDPSGPCGQHVNLTNAVKVTYVP